MGFPRQEYWSGLPFPLPSDLPHPRIKTMSLTSPALAGSFFNTMPPGKSEDFSFSFPLSFPLYFLLITLFVFFTLFDPISLFYTFRVKSESLAIDSDSGEDFGKNSERFKIILLFDRYTKSDTQSSVLVQGIGICSFFNKFTYWLEEASGNLWWNKY